MSNLLDHPENIIESIIVEGAKLLETQYMDFVSKKRTIDQHDFCAWHAKATLLLESLLGHGNILADKVKSLDCATVETVNSCLSILETTKAGLIEGTISPSANAHDTSADSIHSSAVSHAPDLSRLIGHIQGLQECIAMRWDEATRCELNGCYFSAVILIGSILEAILYARIQLDILKAQTASCVPKSKNGIKKIDDWGLDAMIKVAEELGWIKKDRGRFGAALRRSRNVVHPIVQLKDKADFDQVTCQMSWMALIGSIQDLQASIGS